MEFFPQYLLFPPIVASPCAPRLPSPTSRALVTTAGQRWVSRLQPLGAPCRDWWRGAYVTPAVKGRACDARTPPLADWLLRGRSTVEPGVGSLLPHGCHCHSLPRSRGLRRRLCRRCGTGCMIRPQSLMSKQAPVCGGLGHAFMEFLKGPRDYCQAQHDLCEDQ